MRRTASSGSVFLLRARFSLRSACTALVLVAAVGAALCLGGCEPSANMPARGSILTADGETLALTVDESGGSGKRAYPFGEVAAPLVGSLYTADAPAGIEQTYEEALLAQETVTLTVDAGIQRLAYDALGSYRGAVVVLDPDTGAVLALASTPAYDPELTSDQQNRLANRATELHVPGSTFKTITLAAALESGVATLDTLYSAASSLTFEGGAVTNYDTMQYPDQTLLQAYTKSINTVFAQLSLRLGERYLLQMARSFGFDEELLADIPCAPSTIYDVGQMSALMQAWTGVGQALYRPDGRLQGPVMSAVHGAAIAGAIANGGVLYAPYLVQQVGEAYISSGENAVGESGSALPEGGLVASRVQPRVVSSDFLSANTVEGIRQGMESVVREGTGRRAQVAGAEVAGKTGTAETADAADDGWFLGYASKDGATYALCVLVGGAESSEACEVAHTVIEGLF